MTTPSQENQPETWDHVLAYAMAQGEMMAAWKFGEGNPEMFQMHKEARDRAEARAKAALEAEHAITAELLAALEECKALARLIETDELAPRTYRVTANHAYEAARAALSKAKGGA